MTVTSHGFPNGDRVFPSVRWRQRHSERSSWKSDVDVALVKLHDKVQFVNETFESSVDGATVQLKGFVTANQTQVGSVVYMNNPFTTCGPHVRMCVPSDDLNELSLKWIKTRW